MNGMDQRLKIAWRTYSTGPTAENAGHLRAELKRSGSSLGKRLVFDVHIAANRARALDALDGDEPS